MTSWNKDKEWESSSMMTMKKVTRSATFPFSAGFKFSIHDGHSYMYSLCIVGIAYTCATSFRNKRLQIDRCSPVKYSRILDVLVTLKQPKDGTFTSCSWPFHAGNGACDARRWGAWRAIDCCQSSQSTSGWEGFCPSDASGWKPSCTERASSSAQSWCKGSCGSCAKGRGQEQGQGCKAATVRRTSGLKVFPC